MSIFGKQNYCMSCMEPMGKNTDTCPKCGFQISSYPMSARYLKPGTIINDRYLTGCTVSENSFCVTYMGMDLTEKKKKIIKEYFPSSCASRADKDSDKTAVKVNPEKETLFKEGLSDYISQFKKLKELGSLDGVSHVTDILEAMGTAYAVCDFFDGKPLKKIIKSPENKFSSKQMFAVMKPLVNSLITLHKENIFHGAINPFNILISEDMKNVCLTGFGIYGVNDNCTKFGLNAKEGFTPIEEYTEFKGNIGGWTDIFGICSTIYFGITGTVPEDAPDRTVSDDIKAPSEMGIAISENKEAALMQGLEVYERDRFKAVRALYNALYAEDEEVVYSPDAPESEEKAPEDAKPAAEAKNPADEVKPSAETKPAEEIKKPVENVKPEEVKKIANEVKAAAETAKPVAEKKPEENAAPLSPVKEYSQVIVRRKSRDNVEICGQRYSKNTEKLELISKGVTDNDTESIDALENLEYLILDDNKIGSVEFVSRLKGLVMLSLSKNYITDISPLVNLGNLTELNLSGNKDLSDISVLEYLRGIRKLDLSDTAVKDVKSLIYLDHLKSLNLKGTDVSERQIKALYAEMPTCSIKYDPKK